MWRCPQDPCKKMSGVTEVRARRTAKVDFCCVRRTRRERCEALDGEICRVFTVLSQILLRDGVGIRKPRDVLRSRRQRGEASEGDGPHSGRSCGGFAERGTSGNGAEKGVGGSERR